MFFLTDITAKVRKGESSHKGAGTVEVLKRGNSFILRGKGAKGFHAKRQRRQRAQRGKGVSRKEAKSAKGQRGFTQRDKGGKVRKGGIRIIWKGWIRNGLAYA